MRHARTILITVLASLLPATAMAMPMLYVDSAPNVYGSSAWAPWWSNTKTDVMGGTFTNMRTGLVPGTTRFHPLDEIVYSTMDLGKRLHWIYWLPGETLTGLEGRFQVKWVIDYYGDDWTYEGGSWAADAPEVGWSQPSSWEEVSGSGVIGSFGFAWWATDDETTPFDTGGSPYDEVDMADVNALAADVFTFQTFARGYIRYRPDVNSDWVTSELQVDIVPEPTSLMLIVAGGATALAGLRRRRKS
jgi:hypothetical protein